MANFILVLIQSQIRSKYWQPIVALHLANFIVALIQSQFYENIDIQSMYRYFTFGQLHRDPYPITILSKHWHPIDIYRYLFANFIVILIQSANLSKHWHTIDISLLYIRLILSWHFSKHRSIDTSNRYIVTFWLILSSSNHTSIETLISNRYIVTLHLTNFIIYTQIP